MKCNVGGLDRAARILLGLVLVGLTLAGQIGLWGWLGMIPLLTGLIRFCPIYSLLGITSGKSCCAGNQCQSSSDKTTP